MDDSVSEPPRLDGRLLNGMRLVRADVDHAAGSGHDLRLSTSTTSHPVVLQEHVACGDLRLVLEVLAASHRVAVYDVSGALVAIETLACAPLGSEDSSARAFPSHAEWSTERADVRFAATLTAGEESLRSALDTIRARSGNALVVQFPGDPLCLTALTVDCSTNANRIGWRTWHLYPGPGAHTVETATVVRTREGVR